MSSRDVRVVCPWPKASGTFFLRSLSRYVRPNRAETTTRTEQATISTPPSLFCQSLV